MADEPINASEQPARGIKRDDQRRRLLIFLKESSLGVLLGLVFFALLLALLSVGFPEATGLGELVRTRVAGREAPSDLDFGLAPVAFVATLSNVRRDVRDKPASSVIWGTSNAGSPLGDRHAVQSYENSGATIVFGQDNKIELGEKSLIIIRHPRQGRETDRKRAAVLFMSGSVRGHLGAGGDDPEVELLVAGGAIRAVNGENEDADISLSLDSETSTLAVHEGTAEVVWGGETTTVAEGHMVSFDEENAPGTPVLLPRQPELIVPHDGAAYRYRDAPPQIEFEWKPLDDTTEFRVQIARDAGFARPVYDQRQSRTSLVHGNLPAGQYYWRVFARRGPIESPVGVTRELAVGQDGKPPLLEVDLPEGPVTAPTVVLRGSTEPGCRVFISDVRVPTDSEGRFEHELTLRNGYNFVVLQAIDDSGNTAFENRTIIARLSDSERKP